MQTSRKKAEAQDRRAKLASSYHELLQEFASGELRSVGNYTLGRLIGKGSFGKVYLASHKLTNGSKVVLKSAKKDDPNLAREIHHHRQFLHPHIARLYEVIVTESLVWLVLEYCPGDELYNYLLQHGALPIQKVQKIFAQLVGAVSYVHGLSCVHRDLKLENILLDKNENVKLCDFGFTREYEGTKNYLQTFCGTVCYSAPEMLKGEKYAGEKVDVWSLGVILYALLCGELPFDEDDDNLTRTKILGSEPKWPEHLTPDARSLIVALLSKRPLLRPCLSEILAHPFLVDHAYQQQAILKIQQPAPFATSIEKDTLQRMQAAGVDVDLVMEHVLSRRCDALAGWWALLIDKEERKQLRKDRKRRERDAENRTSRRFSGASSRVGSVVHVLPDGNDTNHNDEASASRGRKARRSAHFPELVLPGLPGLPEHAQADVSTESRPPPVEKERVRSASSSRRRRPIPPPKEGTIRGARSRGSTLQLVASNADILSGNDIIANPPRKRRQHAFIAQLSHWKQWLVTSAKGSKPTNRKASASTPDLSNTKSTLVNGHVSPSPGGPSTKPSTAPHPNELIRGQSYAGPPRLQTTTLNKRSSLSPSPLTPRSGFRRQSGLRGRKSTSSSVSSIRSMHHHHQHSHSKASSTSSNGSEAVSRAPSISARSPHHSVKVLPATPTTSTFPSNIRVVRQTPISSFNEGANWARESSPAGLLFAKRKRNIFKGPVLHPVSTGAPTSNGHDRKSGHSRSTSLAGGRSEDPIEEEDEDGDDGGNGESEVIEEVETFSPVIGPHVQVEIFSDSDTLSTATRDGEHHFIGPLPAFSGSEV